jgi:hypothetical protein
MGARQLLRIHCMLGCKLLFFNYRPLLKSELKPKNFWNVNCILAKKTCDAKKIENISARYGKEMVFGFNNNALHLVTLVLFVRDC